jgi:hypothetical protein
MDRVILRFCQRVSSKELFAPKEIQTLNLIGLSQRPKSLPLEPTSWGYSTYYIQDIGLLLMSNATTLTRATTTNSDM